MDLTATESYLLIVIVFLSIALMYVNSKYQKAMYSGGMLTQVIKAVAAGKGELTSTPNGEVIFRQTKE